MRIDAIPNRNSPPATPAILVRESYREDGKVKKRTLANISNWDPEVALSRHLSPDTATSTLGEELGLGEVDEHGLYGAMRWLLER